VLVNLRLPSLTIENTMACRKVADFSGQHTFALVNRSLSVVELTAIRDAGVKVLVVPPDTTGDELKALVKAISELPKKENKKDRQTVALLPKLGMAPAPREEEGGDEDGDE
jgi:hypothetical protein